MDNQLDTLLHLNRRLRTLVLRAIIARWQSGEREIASQDLYTELVEAGEGIPAGAMAVVFDNLRALKLIGGSLPDNAMALSMHGDTRVAWLDPSLLTEAEEG
jgi:hypothetical protein